MFKNYHEDVILYLKLYFAGQVNILQMEMDDFLGKLCFFK